jgi:hypothetical protein
VTRRRPATIKQLPAPEQVHDDPDLLSSANLFKQFLNGRRYLKNVTPDTIEWYETAWKALPRTLGTDAPPITKTSLQSFVVKMRQRDVKPISVNTYIKALNAFCRWLHETTSQQSHRGYGLTTPRVDVCAFSGLHRFEYCG